MAPPEPEPLLSFPDLALRLPAKIDELRKAVRKNPALLRMFVSAGPLKVLPLSRLDRFRAELASASPKLCPAAAPATCSGVGSAA
ncbi:hypothetical protein [Gemmata sp.]|uniref:hypothetical protein n=1 Tax=Gemmata sp. TaxID=1914242 RepID=UPI003F71171E